MWRKFNNQLNAVDLTSRLQRICLIDAFTGISRVTPYVSCDNRGSPCVPTRVAYTTANFSVFDDALGISQTVWDNTRSSFVVLQGAVHTRNFLYVHTRGGNRPRHDGVRHDWYVRLITWQCGTAVDKDDVGYVAIPVIREDRPTRVGISRWETINPYRGVLR